ncbi:MAG: cysteine--tRNA ligase [gamma proteobacterium symbiont of Bathyaustriella thionipta]|nr:cysteine--tRNA ligase [gamma proteobacterium symbiont of Bathyaustriella thionipta]MCU7949618.1 cysteine--tRNA ligase [gamma proteobacterium symbiont of Bathyaustriella thionipta]MCU7954754.1 cysteine--tRNA ligase [gamma proteobacterium symbiont of Bathyaustriella thionipta]MCU7956594.1 cysteine--tRNA ligase [gamma proteobacterium symbiont of Bathyaustriella thionipta]MCU7967912.1 cysteine--tRNA ligase [gamma proteobacterium symbiont of Bathyaustriella thionipta]
MLHIQNTLSGQKERFTPIHPGKVNMYVCGMTVYDYCHIGHARVLVVFDVISRYLRKIYGAENVTYVRNITDIDDKIIARAIENGEDINTLTDRFIEAMHEDADALGVKRPDIEPRATEHMSEILQMIQTLIDKGLAYQADNGDVYYQVSQFKTYGQMAKKNLADLQSGSRVEVEQAKRDPMDFVLWKMAKEGEPSWDSSWGKGRPGWHIECSAMSTNCLGDHFDIHGGGLDLKFPHHENEIAQSEGCTGHKFVNYWIHNGFVRVDDEKMSKSLGNFFIIREVLQSYAPEVIRYFILNSHYMSPLNYSDENLDKAKASLTTLYQALLDVQVTDDTALDEKSDYSQRFFHAMDDDFNTPMAISVLFDMSHELNRLKSSDMQQAGVLAVQLKKLAQLLGLLENDAQQFLQGSSLEGGLSDNEINDLIEQRTTAKQDKNWSECDRIRDVLDAEAILLEDTPEGTRWRRK